MAISIPLAIAFTKHLGQIFLPGTGDAEASANGSTPAGTVDDNLEVEKEVAPSPQEKDKFKKLLTAYYEALARRAVKDHTVC